MNPPFDFVTDPDLDRCRCGRCGHDQDDATLIDESGCIDCSPDAAELVQLAGAVS